jgi:hypothetical protein
VPFEVLGLLQQDFDLAVDGENQLAMVDELLDRDQAFRLVPHVDDYPFGRDANDLPRHNLTLGEIAHAFVIQLEELAVLVRFFLFLT